MEILQSAYHPQNMTKLKMINFEEARKALDLYEHWRTPPGTLNDGSFDEPLFATWIEQVLALAEDVHYTPVAQVKIGHSSATRNVHAIT